MNTPHDPGILKEVTNSISKIVDIFTRPFEVVSKAVADRLERWLKRKPKLFVRFHPQTTFWCLAFAGEQKAARYTQRWSLVPFANRQRHHALTT